MKLNRVWAIVVRHTYEFRHCWEKLSDAFYWPLMDLLLWGLTSTYILEHGDKIPNIVIILLTGLLYWQIVWRSQYEITVGLLDEIWSNNIVNLFSTPLRLREWVGGVVVLSIIKLVFTLGFASLLAYILYAVNIYSIGFAFIPFLGLLLLSGWFVGFLIAGLIFTYGTRIQTMAWAGVYLIAPFSGIYYPISVLPQWAQGIARFTPTSYVFEGMREILTAGTVNIEYMLISLVLNIIYLLVSILLFKRLFNLRKRNGLAELDML